MKRMKRLLLALMLSITLIASVALPTLADSGEAVQLGDKIIMKGGFEAVCIGYNKGGQPLYQVDLSAPTYLPDLTTKIDTEWHLDKSGYYTSGANLFHAFVSSEFVSISEVGQVTKSISWQPSVSVKSLDKVKDKSGVTEGNQTVKKSNAILLAVDPLNANYKNNTLEWDYGNGVYRRLRLIEGMQQEYYVITKAIAGDFEIKSNATKQGIESRQPVAWDSDYKVVDITVDSNHNITLTKTKALDSKVKYPIIIDPDTTFTTSASDASLDAGGLVWATQQALATATSGGSNYSTIQVGTYTAGGAVHFRYIHRGYLYFPTSALAGYVVTNAVLSLRVAIVSTEVGAYTIRVQNGQPTYPHDPLVTTDFNKTYYSGNGGNLTTSAMVVGAYSNITLTDMSWINTTGTTKLVLREKEHDIDNVDIGDSEVPKSNRVQFNAYESGIGYRPQLVVTFTALTPAILSVNASTIAKTSARLNSTITNDGGDTNCEVRFGYGTTTKTTGQFATYDVVTAWVGGYKQGDNPYFDATGLTANTPYFFRVQVKNELTTVTSATEQTFATLNTIADITNFEGFPDSTSISLGWVRGDGASRVLVKFAPDTYPATTADGTQIYLGVNSSYAHIGLTAGTTYFYTAWGESGGVYSSVGGVNLALTTDIELPTGDTLPEPTQPSGWNQPANSVLLANLEPFYSIVNNMADDWGMNRNVTWVILALLTSFCGGIGFYIKFRAPALSLLIIAVIMAGGVLVHILPSQFLWFVAVLGLGAWGLRSQGQGG